MLNNSLLFITLNIVQSKNIEQTLEDGSLYENKQSVVISFYSL